MSGGSAYNPPTPLPPMLMLKFAPQCALWPAGGAVIALQTSALTVGTESCTYTVINETTGRGNEWKSLIKVFTLCSNAFECRGRHSGLITAEGELILSEILFLSDKLIYNLDTVTI